MKTLKLPLPKLRLDKLTIAAYFDDWLNMDGKIQPLLLTLFKIWVLLSTQIFLLQTQQTEFFGFEINSVFITITLTNAKTENLKLFCTNIWVVEHQK